MADAILYGIAQEVLKNLGSRALNEIASTWGFKDRLEKLERTVKTIKNVLLDAEEKQAAADGHAVRGWLEELATVVYAADDLFDEFNTIASRKQLLRGNRMTKEMRTFFSTSNQIAFAVKLSRKIKSIREKLEDIRKDGADFGLAQRAHLQQRSTITGGRDQSYSYVDEEQIIGRDEDKKNILDLLLASDSTDKEQEPEVLPIVGIGGMGKTALAQLIYNDSQVQNHFELRLWVCVAEDFDIKLITEKILRSITHTETPKLDMEQLQSKLRSDVSGKKYLLVLDDVWEENPNKWGELRALLKIGRKGSKIIVTTRLPKVADIMGTYPSHQLKGLSENQSWALFEKLAFKSGEAQHKLHLVKVGKEILKKCANVPLAIKTLGGILRFEDEDMWMSFKDKNLTEVMDVLKLSYQHLQSPWKNCFAYCALFPKDHLFDKELLIDLWMAEGFIIPCENGDQSLEDVAEGYFINLLQRGLFQDVQRNEWGDIMRFKMHDLVHDLAQEEAKGKCVTKLSETDFEDTTLHLSIIDELPSSGKIPNEMLNLKLLRTYLYMGTVVSPFVIESTLQQLVTKFCHLRVLVLPRLELKSLPSSIGKLIHLRYLNLSRSKIEALPGSIVNLYNLQTLNLCECRELKALPVNIEKLVNLRSLNLTGCNDLTHMPSGIGELTLLRKLTMFIVGHKQFVELKKKPTSTSKLSDLKKLNNLIGELEIRIHNSSENNMTEAVEAGIINKHGLTNFTIAFDSEMTAEPNKMNHDEAVLEALKPSSNLRKLGFGEYAGNKVPSWARMDNLAQNFPKLVHINLWKCKNCKQLPSFSQLPSLKSLHLKEMESVVYMESDVIHDSPSSKSHGSDNLFFPSLENLELRNMKNLKGWWKEVIEESSSNDDTKKIGGSPHNVVPSSKQHLSSLQFIKLKEMVIYGCPNLTVLPLFPNLKRLELYETNKKLSLLKMAPIENPSSSKQPCSKLKDLSIDDVDNLISLTQLGGLGQLSSLYLIDNKLESTEILREVFATLSSSLRYLRLQGKSLRYISEGLEHLTALEDMSLSVCEELELEEGARDESYDEKDLMPWITFKTSLRTLKFLCLPKVASLPTGIQQLTNLHTLYLFWLEELREIPEWINCLSSLQFLQLRDCPKLTSLPQSLQKLTSLYELLISCCPGLTKRCQRLNGTDWPKIQHIPRVYVED